jgi:hypothetical protein
MSAKETPPKVTTKDGNAPTPASEEKMSTLVKPCRIYSPSKHSTCDFCGNELEDSDFASNESDAECMRVPPAKCLKQASCSQDEAGDDDHDDNEEEDKKLPGKLDDNNDERKMPANEDGVKEEQSSALTLLSMLAIISCSLTTVTRWIHICIQMKTSMA